MLLIVTDGGGQTQTIIVSGQATPTDKSGDILAADTAQDVFDENAERSGYYFHNLDAVADMWLSELGEDATAASPCFLVPAGAVWPPTGYAVTAARVSVISSVQGAKYLAREW